MDTARERNDQQASAATRYAYMRRDGTTDIVLGSLVAGIGAYVYQFLGGRSLGTDGFAPIGVLLTAHFLAFVVVLMPVEQFIIRRITLGARGWVIPLRALALIVATTLGAVFVVANSGDDYFTTRNEFIVFIVASMATHTVFVFGRGYLAGFRKFRAYGYSSGAASILRLAVAIAVAVLAPSVTGFAWAHILGPLVVLAWRPFRSVESERRLDAEHIEAMGERGLLAGLVLSAAASQALLLAGPLVASRLSATAAEFSITYATLLIARAPLTFGYNLIARVLPPFTEMAARGERRELRAWARGIGIASLFLSAFGALAGALLGPLLVGVAFGQDFMPTATVAALAGAGVVFAGGGLFIGQILVARGRPLRLGIAWGMALVSAVAVVAIPMDDPVLHVVVAFLVGELVALIALMTAALVPDRSEGEVGHGYVVLKRSLDIAVSLVLLVLLSPVLLLASIAVRIDSEGPAFFRQQRVGKDGADFWMVKLRTMVIDHNEEVFHQHLERLQETDDAEIYTIRIDADPRVTRVGAVLRRWSLDEIPNLWNVLKGNMSLVGPRPLVRAEAELIGLDNIRFTVKPGVTGLAQVGGRDNIPLEARTRFDEQYVAQRSLRLDLRVLIATFTTVFHDPGEHEE